MKVTKTLYTETAHRLLNHPGACRYLHGHSYKWEVTATGDVDERGMVLDFHELKGVLVDCIMHMDHAVVLSIDDPLVQTLEGTGQNIVVMSSRPTAENMAKEVALEVQRCLPLVQKVVVKLWETTTSYAEAESL